MVHEVSEDTIINGAIDQIESNDRDRDRTGPSTVGVGIDYKTGN